ncbi:hypothetical protein SFC79_17060 [Nocardioides sp. S-58]|uniref:AAA+ ATPase domain-containing protein n=1 Tax=Nocardioides renjunii TaxID=3095075 RepID=A0ABU5KEV7_9ACTN|nr:hypothetical protein [Nocardioides sp. S-58]MDZ5663486.1 hypothetical protein [Nocardioides sp. S-58]
MIDEAALEVFEERAENLSDEDFLNWTARAPHEAQIVRQLTSSGPKLLSGPRGCGKSTLLRTAAIELRSRGKSVPVEVNFGRSMFIEPAFTRRSDADGFFQDWLISKLVEGAASAFERAGHGAVVPTELLERAADFVVQAEVDSDLPRQNLPGPVQLSKLLTQWAQTSGFTSVILLLDDAAHAFVPEQQRIFFEVLRGLRSPSVTYKAAIYPGVTEFSPNFHIGHDAKVVRAWVPVEGSGYIEFMRSAYDRRIPDEIRPSIPHEVVDFFAVSSFGIPRAFFSMLEAYLEARRPDTGKKPRVPLAVVNEHSDSLHVLHRSLAVKLPRYEGYVSAGNQVLRNAIKELRDLNEKRATNKQEDSAIDLAVRQPVDAKLSTVFGLLEYAGLVRNTNESISLGDYTYSKYSIHGSLLVSGGALKFGQNPTLQDRVDALLRGSRTGTYKRISSTALLDEEAAEQCHLKVGSCPSCGTPRPSETAKFCANCGQALVDSSRLGELLATSISDLSLTENKKQALLEVGVTTIETVVRDRGLVEISKAKGVGTVWARRIFSLAEEYVGV